MFGGQVITGLLIPFVGTTAGAACVFFIKRDFSRNVQRALTGFAAGASEDEIRTWIDGLQ